MNFTHTGQMDTSLEPSMFVTVPEGLDLPAPLKKVADAHDKALDAWSSADLALAEATAALENAGADDKALLIAAIKAGEPDPGTPTQTKALRACVVAEETCRIRTSEYEVAARALLAALPAHKAALITQAVALERDVIARYVTAIEEARTIATQAEAALRTLGSHINFVTEHLHLGFENHVEPTVDPVTFPATWRAQQERPRTILDTLEASVTKAATA